MWLETLNKLLYSSKHSIYFFLRIASLLSSVIALGFIIYGFGFYHDDATMKWIYHGLNLVFASFLVNYLLRVLYSFKRVNFLRRTWIECLVILIIIVNYILKNVYNTPSERLFYKEYVVLFLIFLSLYEFIKASTRINLIHYKPTTMFLGSFVILISFGTLLLLLPTSTYGRQSMSFIDAFFTATSASCVTGLTVVDTYTYFTFKGQFFILILMQLGGLGIISFATFFSTFFTKGVGIKHQFIVHDIYSTESLISAKKLFKTVILISLAIELFFSIVIYFTWPPEYRFHSIYEKIYFSVFHAISAFNNAGFSLFPNGMYEPVIRHAYVLHLVLAAAIILGGLGFPVIEDLFNIQKLRERLKYPWKDWQLSTKVSVYTSAALIVFGMAMIFLLEKDNTLKEMNFMEGLIASFFQSVTTRTAGLNTIPISELRHTTIMIMIFLMFIGASPASTGGGIKTSTFLVIFLTSIATITEKGKVELGKRTITQDIIFRAFSVFAFAVTFNFVSLIILMLAEPGKDFLSLCFEQVSAFGTVGLSRGITPHLSYVGKCMIVISMFAGRVGLLTLALALTRKVATTAYRYPNAHLMVG